MIILWKKYPRNLLLNQYKIDLINSKNNFDFDCKKKQHIVAEILYITANALSSQSIYPLSNFYLNLSKYLNDEFLAFDTLMAENLYKINDLSGAKNIYKKLTNMVMLLNGIQINKFQNFNSRKKEGQIYQIIK